MLAKQFVKGFKEGFQAFGGNIAWVVTSALLLMTYVIGIGIVALPARLFFRKEFLPFTKRKADSYWVPRKEPKKEDFERTF